MNKKIDIKYIKNTLVRFNELKKELLDIENEIEIMSKNISDKIDKEKIKNLTKKYEKRTN